MTIKSRIQFLLAISFLTIASQGAVGRPVVVGNGGDAVQCNGSEDQQNHGKFQGLYSLDYLLTLRSQNQDLVSWQSLDDAWSQLTILIERVLPEHARRFAEFKKYYRNSQNRLAPRFWEEAPFGLIPLDDQNMVNQLPSECRKDGRGLIVQAVVRQNPDFSGSNKIIYKFVPEVLDELASKDPRQLSFLFIHEWLWDLSQNVDQNRRLNRFLHEQATYDMKPEEARAIIQDMGYRLSPDPLQLASTIAIGETHACALDDMGVYCWGAAGDVPSLDHPTAIGAGDSVTCALDANGVQCWGARQFSVPPLHHPYALSVGDTHACSLDDTGVVCWGDNEGGQSTPPRLKNPRIVSAGSLHTCAIDDDGLQCWGQVPRGSERARIKNPVFVSAGRQETCVIDDDGVKCWGAGTAHDDIPSMTTPKMVSLGTDHACAIDNTSVKCWGFFDRESIPNLTNPSAVAVGRKYTCARDDHGLSCWGMSNFSKIPVPSR